MINAGYKDKVAAIRQAFEQEGVVLLQDFLNESFEVEGKQQYHPLQYRWKTGKVEIPDIQEFLKSITGKTFSGTTYILGKGDYSLLADEIEPEQGIVAFMNLTEEWNDTWGGYLGLEQDKVALPCNALLIVDLTGHRWFVKYVNHLTQQKKKLLVFRQR